MSESGRIIDERFYCKRRRQGEGSHVTQVALLALVARYCANTSMISSKDLTVPSKVG